MTTIDDLSATTLATLARVNAALDRRDVDGCVAEMTEDSVFENTSPAPDGEQYEGIALQARRRNNAEWQKYR